jgi:hypothetical protein
MGGGNITYFNPDLVTGLQSLSSFSGCERFSPPLVRPLYTAAIYNIISRTQYVDHNSPTYRDVISSLGGQSAAGIQAAMDPWGNVRIPHLEYLEDYDRRDPHK